MASRSVRRKPPCVLVAALVLGGCAGVPLRFEGPVGARVRIDGSAPEAIPFSRAVSAGTHALEVEPPPAWTSASGQDALPSARGFLLLLDPARTGTPPITIPEADLRMALGGSSVLWWAADDRGGEAILVKIAAGGVDPDDPDLAGAVARAEERRAAAAEEARRKAAGPEAAVQPDGIPPVPPPSGRAESGREPGVGEAIAGGILLAILQIIFIEIPRAIIGGLLGAR